MAITSTMIMTTITIEAQGFRLLAPVSAKRAAAPPFPEA